MKTTLLNILIQKPQSLMFLVPTTVLASHVVDFKAVFYILIYLFCLDLITGVCASYFDWKKQSEKKDKWFFGRGEGFSSDKFKKCLIKILIYAGVPIIVYKFQTIFLLKTLSYKNITNSEIEITSILILLFCVIELFSIFHENLPRCGFNIFKIFKEMVGIYKNVKKEI